MNKAEVIINERQEEGKEMIFDVEIRDDENSTRHVVEVDEQSLVLLTGECIEAEELVRRSVEFLLEREPKESILRHFNIMKIAEYFPEYRDMMRKSCGLK